ncbi:nitrogen fixation negative regulator NifL [Propionivibrio limicola]|uniref:nitrogen fixation negative regulator NifL n=1 Tax=Propionivibrio limicola TaxID=167645 RepID=UPI001FE3BEF1|nr:nitrogen fixation negative regulator NifL [Propionivibrio limicola]
MEIQLHTPHDAKPAIAPEVFQQAVEQADIAISITDADANILYVNPAFTRVTGYAPDDVIGANSSVLSHKATPEEIYKQMWAQLHAGHAWSGRLVNRRKDGAKYLADLLITPVADADGGVTRFLGIHRDITTLHELECEVIGQKALIESVVDSAPVVLALLDAEEKVVLDNHEYKKLMIDLHVADPAAQILAAIRANDGSYTSLPGRGRYAFNDREVRIDTPGGAPRWFSCSGIWVQRNDSDPDRFFDQRNALYLLLVAKETTRQKMEQEKTRLALLQAMMAEESRVDGLREILTAAVFKIEGPLNIMASVLATMERRSGNNGHSGSPSPAAGVLAEAMHAGREAVESLRSAIPGHLAESRTSVNVNEAIRDVLDLTTMRMLSAGVTVQWRPQAVLPSVNAYPNRVRMMFKAIVDNAIDAMNTKGWRQRDLFVTTRATGTNGDSVEVVIEDSGPGIPPELRLKVFEPFFSTRKAGGQHLGTGLSSAQQVAADHNGVIELDETSRGGCRVRITLPAQ